MTTFHPQQSDCGRRVQKMANADTFNFTPQNLHSHSHEARKNMCSKFQGTVQEHVNEWSFYTREALPLVLTRFLRLAQISPMDARSPARRSRDGSEMSGKKSGEISRVMSAQHPGNGRTMAKAMPPDVRQDDSQANLPCAGLWPRRKLARQLAICPRNSRAAARAPAKATSRKQLVEIPSPAFNHDIQKIREYVDNAN